MVGGPNGPGLTPQKTSNFWRKKLRLLEFFGEKNSSPIFSKLVRARAINPFILLVGTSCKFIFEAISREFHRLLVMDNSFCEVSVLSFHATSLNPKLKYRNMNINFLILQ